MKSLSLKKISGLIMAAILLVAGLGAVFSYSHKVHADDSALVVTTLADDVDDSICTSDHCTLREAIAAATPGSTITFASGLTGKITLAGGALNIYGTLTITGPGADKIIIDGAGSQMFNINTDPGAAVSISGLTLQSGTYESGGEISNFGSDLTVSNMTFKNGLALGGGAIFSLGGTLTVTNSTFLGGAAEYGGGGIYLATGSATITDSTFLGNFTGSDGGAIYVSSGSLAVSGSTFDGNNTQGGQGGAIYDNDDTPGTLTLTNTAFNSNMSNNQGGAIYTYANLVSTGSSFTNNYSGSSGGAIYANGATVGLTNTDFTNDASNGDGGAIHISVNGTSTVTGGTFAGNYANDCDGGAIYTDTDSALHVSGATFKNNNSDCRGGALYLNASSDIASSTFTANKSFEDGGAIYYNSGDAHTVESTVFDDNTAEYYGGAISHRSGTLSITDHSSFTGNIADVYDDGDAGGAIDSEGTSLTVTDTQFTNNKAATSANGGAVYVNTPATFTRDDFSGNMAGYNGGALDISGGPVTISASTFYGNMTGNDSGGAIYHNNGDLTIHNSSFVENIAGNEDPGGAIYGNGNSLTITGTEFDRNASPYYDGGAIYINENTSIDTSAFVGNTSYQGGGGALYIEGGPLTVSVSNSTFAENASQYGGAIRTNGSTVTLTNLTLSNNTATSSGGSVYSSGGGTVTAKNSIFAGGSSSNCNTDLTTAGYNISSDATCGMSDTTDRQNMDPKLDPEGPKVASSGPLLDGDPYLSIVATKADSPAVDSGDNNSCSTHDQIGGSRVGENCDMGAYEYNASTAPSISAGAVFHTPDIVVTRLDDPDGGTCSSGTDCSLRQAVALSTSGQTIGFSSGLTGTLTLGGFISVDHPLTISGPGEKLLTLSGGAATNLFSVTANGALSLDHLTIANSQNLTGDAGAIYNLGPVNTSHVTFRNNSASGEGGAIYSDCGVANRNQTFDFTTFEGNHAGETGGAVYVCGNSSDLNTLAVTNGTLVDNFASGSGGAIYANTTSVSLAGTTLRGNYSGSEGGAVYINTTNEPEPVLSVTTSSFIGNRADYGGAISNGNSSGVHLSISGDVSFIGNLAYNNGGAINLSGGYVDTLSADFHGNFSNWDGGGAIYLSNLLGSGVTINSSLFTHNVAGDDVGGAIAFFSEGTDLAITGSTTFTGNSALYDNGAGAIYDDARSLTLTGTTFNHNASWDGYGGAIYVANGDLTMTGAVFNDNVAMDVSAGAIDYEAGGAISVTSSTFTGNQAIYGSSGAVQQGDSTASATISGSTFTDNMAYAGSTGAWHQYAGNVTITNSIFTGNSATNEVGALQQDTGDLVITGTSFDHNSALGYGAAIYDHQPEGTTTINNSTFYRNIAPWDEGGGYYHDGGGNAIINNVTFDQNVSSTDGGNAFTVYTAPTVVTNSIFVGSPFGSCQNYDGGIDQLNSTHNIDDGSGCFDPDTNTILVNPSAVFSAAGLSDNGGPTGTVALAAGSPAIDAGNDSTCETTDQRGTARPQGAHCDIGSFESADVDTSTQAPVLVSPETGNITSVTNSMAIAFTLPETPLHDSIVLTFAPASGSPIVLHLRDANPNVLNQFRLPLSGGIAGVTEVVSSTSDVIPPGMYTVTLSYRDVHGNAAASAISTGVVLMPASSAGSGGSSVGGSAPSIGSKGSKTPVPAVAVPGTDTGTSQSGQGAGSAYRFPRTQKPGVTGDDVTVLQKFLNDHGFPIAPKGPGSKGKETKTFGPATKKALAKYQKSKGMKADGVLGPKTRATIEGEMNK